MLILYQGQFQQRLAWTLLMYTMGAVCVARIAIEQNRTHSISYAAALALAAFVVMVRFAPGSMIFCAGILALIAYLSDRIVHDCTLIDDNVDASGQGLIEFGKGELKRQLAQPHSPPAATSTAEETLAEETTGEETTGEDSSVVRKSPRRKTHQPGRTVMYLALAALPLFGLGQFLLRSDMGTWGTAQWYLTVYLFSSLSLLVTTSFLGLRRYLRQRKVDMPFDVTIAWLAGGLAMIALILSVASIAPMPGKLLTSIKVPDFLSSPKGLKSSSLGWGDEAAEKSSKPSQVTSQDKKAQGKEIHSVKPQEGAPPGDSGDGKGKQGPPGKQDGAKQGAASKKTSPSGQKKSPSGQKPSPSGQKKSPSGQKPSPSGQKKSNSNQSENPQQKQSQQKQSQQKQSQQKQSQQEKSQQEKSNQSKDESQRDSSKADQDRKQKSSDRSDQDAPADPPPNQSSQSNSKPPSNDSGSSASSSGGNLFSAIGGLLKFLIMAGLFAVVAAFVYLHREAIAIWWASLWNRDVPEPTIQASEALQEQIHQPPRPFATFRNPIGNEKDPRRIVVITFQAFEAWTREQGWNRDKNETPNEFIRRVASRVPGAATPAVQIVDAYNRIVYGRGKATEQDMNAAKQVWQAMQA